MIDISYEKNPELYFDYKKGLEFLSLIKDEDYEYPEEITNFHVYTEAKDEKELESIRSYLATQNLEKTKLIVWSNYDISKQENMQPYKDHLDLRVYDDVELAKGTPLEDNKKYLNVYDDERHWMSSGVMRFLVLYKFGGIYMDMDMILLRDFKPILDQSFAYQWGSSVDFAKKKRWEADCHGPCAAMMGSVRGDSYIENCMNQLLITEIRPRTTCFDEDMLGYVYDKNPFTVFPTTFFNTEWLVSKTDPEFRKVLESPAGFSKIQTEKDFLFLDAFAWHWHHSSAKDLIIESGSKFDLLHKRNDLILKEKGII